MQSMKDYKELIELIPVEKQSTRIKKRTWEKFESISGVKKILDNIFGNEEEVELSREDVRSEADTETKIVKILMWGYPTGGRGNNIESILKKIKELSEILLSKGDERNLGEDEADDLIKQFEEIRGLGISTWSKLLYFFDFEIKSKKCQIYDLKIVDSLNKKPQFSELDGQEWKQNIKHYYNYIRLVDELKTNMRVSPDKVELFLFYYNLYYKF